MNRSNSPRTNAEALEKQTRQLIEELNNEVHDRIVTLRKVKRANPSLVVSHSLNAGCILNAYREGDITFDEAVAELESLTANKPVAEANDDMVKVRVAVAVDEFGAYYACGDDVMSDSQKANHCDDVMENRYSIRILTAEVPKPKTIEVPAGVESVKS